MFVLARTVCVLSVHHIASVDTLSSNLTVTFTNSLEVITRPPIVGHLHLLSF